MGMDEESEPQRGRNREGMGDEAPRKPEGPEAQNSSPKLAKSTTTTNSGLSCPLPLIFPVPLWANVTDRATDPHVFSPCFRLPTTSTRWSRRGSGWKRGRRGGGEPPPVCPFLIGWEKEERKKGMTTELFRSDSQPFRFGGSASHRDLVSLKPDRF